MNNVGLSSLEAKNLLSQYGLNELPAKSTYSKLDLMVSQFKNALSGLLFVAATISFLVGDKVDGFLILLILLLNGALGFWQEYKASKELEALRRLEVATTRVIRDGREVRLSATELVPGDIVVLESGDKVPADATVIESLDISVDESALTGESMPVVKSTTDFVSNTVFFGTSIVSGRGKVKVFATGSSTKFGRIALTLASVSEEQTPLEKLLQNLAARIGILAAVLAVGLFLIQIIQGGEIIEVFFTSTALMVAAVPEGLPAIITIALAFGVHRMYKKKALVRRMSSIESLGAATVICTDKTGTLTLNKMKVKEIEGVSSKEDLLSAAIFCNSASLVLKEGEGYDFLGDSTEGALLLWAQAEGLDPTLLKSKASLLDEIPFDLKRRMMSSLWQRESEKTIYSKGAPEVMLPLCNLKTGEIEKLTKVYEGLSNKGLRVLAFGLKQVEGKNTIEEKGLKFLGFVGIADGARPEAKTAIIKARSAGIKVVMVTGDNELTAKVLAQEVGLMEAQDEVLTGKQIDLLSDEELLLHLDKVKVFARVVPEHKLRIVKAFQQKGEIVGVTGDGVNDALALKQAEVGVAMGKSGTDVAKESSDIIILDDNFSTIIEAIEEGRLIYRNILRAVKFLLAGNLSEVLVITLAVVAGFPTPLLPVQILWINFVTDGLPALALVTDPSSKNLMRSKPIGTTTFLSSKTLQLIIISAGIITGLVLFVFWYGVNNFGLESARGLVFTTMVLLQMVLVFAIRGRESIISNKYLVLAVVSVLLIQGLIMSYPPLKELFKII